MVKKIIVLRDKILNEKGPLNLFALVRKDEQDKWDLVISSNIFLGKEKEFLEYFVRLIQGALTNEELNSILQIILLKPEDAFVININSTMKVEGGYTTISNSVFNNILVKEMVLLYSSKIK